MILKTYICIYHTLGSHAMSDCRALREALVCSELEMAGPQGSLAFATVSLCLIAHIIPKVNWFFNSR